MVSMVDADQSKIGNLKSKMYSGGPDADNEHGDSQVVIYGSDAFKILMQRFLKCPVGSPAAKQQTAQQIRTPLRRN